MSEEEKKDEEKTNIKEMIIMALKFVLFILIGTGTMIGITLLLGLFLSLFK